MLEQGINNVQVLKPQVCRGLNMIVLQCNTDARLSLVYPLVLNN